MRFPSATDYMEALQDPASCFSDPQLQAAATSLNPLGLPRALSGNVATVFRVDCPDGRSYAVRCFIRSFEDEEKRYTEIARHLSSVKPDWLVGFEFQPEGILVEGAWWPMVKMEWCDGEQLIPYVERHLFDPHALAGLGLRFAALTEQLRRDGIAHGDLQHGNVLVLADGTLRLIDYDNMFVPGLEGMASNELGHRNYQHPKRTQRDFGPYMDNFPSWVVYASLAAVATDPLLWGRLDGGDECLLFRRRDLDDPDRSPVVAALAESEDEALVELARLLRAFLGRELAAVPPLSPARAPKPAPARGEVAAIDAQELSERQSLYAALRGADPAAPAQTDATTEAVRAAPEPPPPAAKRFSGTLAVPRLTLWGAAGVVVVALVLTGAGMLPLAVGALVPLLVGGAVMKVGGTMYQSLPEVQESRAAQARVAERRAAVERARAVADDLAARRAAVDTDETAAREHAARRAEELKREEAAAVRAVEDELRNTLSALSVKEQQLQKAEREALAAALVVAQQERIDAELARRPIATASGRGVSDQVLYGLALDGIRTAGDFVDVVVRPAGTALVRPDGSEVIVKAIGPEHARSIMAWRRSVIDSVTPHLPDSLSPAQERQIREEYAARRAALFQEEGPAREAATKAVEEVRIRFRPVHEQVGLDLKRTEENAVRLRVELDEKLAQARKDAAEAEWHLRAAEREAAPYRELTLARFFRQVTFR